MKTRFINIISLLLAIVILSSCAGKEFTINGKLGKLGSQNLRVIYFTEKAAEDTSVPALDDVFQIKGNADCDVVVELYLTPTKLLTYVYIPQGGEVEVTGDVSSPFEIQVKGNDLAERWCAWRKENADMLKTNNRIMIEAKVQEYVKAHPDDALNGLLVAYEFCREKNMEQAHQMLLALGSDCPPAAMRRFDVLYDETFNAKINENAKIEPFSLYSDNDSIDDFSPKDSPFSILYFWTCDDRNRQSDVRNLRQMIREYPSAKLQVADVAFENDSAVWKREIKQDTVYWTRYWALGGALNSSVKAMGVTEAPSYLVLDSVGKMHYRGNSLQQVKVTLKKIIH